MRKWWLFIFAGLVTGGLALYLAQGRISFSLAAGGDAFPPPPIKKRAVRDREAQKVEKIFDEVEARNKTPQSAGPRYKISESELNSYLSHLMEKENVQGVDALFVKLREGSFSTYAVINVDNIPQKDKNAATRIVMQTILSGKQYVSADGSLTTQNGLGQYTLTGARLNEIDIPPGIVNSLINAVGKKQNPPFDLTKPFRLPYKIREASVKPGYLDIS